MGLLASGLTGLFGKSFSDQVVVVAEIGVNHEGDGAHALRLVALAAEAGADAVKFQTYSPERFVAASDAERLARVRRFDLGMEGFRRVCAEADRLGIACFSSAVTEDVVPALAERCPAIKIASGDLTFEPVVRGAARTGKPVLLSTGMATVEETDRSVGWIREEIGDAALADRLVLLHCVSAYPAPLEQAAVLVVPFLADRYGVAVGYSHHAPGLEPCLAAVALGAVLIEVHFTDCKHGRSFRDHSLSFEPAELALLVESVARVRACLGRPGVKEPQPCEIAGRISGRKGVIAATDLPTGTVLTAADLMYARPAEHIPSSGLPGLVGRRLCRAVPRGHMLRPDDVEPGWLPSDGVAGRVSS